MIAPRRIRYAVVGLGHIAQEAILPAFAGTGGNSELAALVSGDAVKRSSSPGSTGSAPASVARARPAGGASEETEAAARPLPAGGMTQACS